MRTLSSIFRKLYFRILFLGYLLLIGNEFYSRSLWQHCHVLQLDGRAVANHVIRTAPVGSASIGKAPIGTRDAQPIWSRHVLCPYVT